MKNVHYEIILQSLTEDLLRRDAKIKDLERRYDELKAVHAADTNSHYQKISQKDRQIKELQNGIDKLTNEKIELAKTLQNSSSNEGKDNARQKAISECVDLVNQIYDFCKEHNLKLSMDFTNDGNDPRFAIWNHEGSCFIGQVIYCFDWASTLKALLDRLEGNYKMCVEDKDDCTVVVKPKMTLKNESKESISDCRSSSSESTSSDEEGKS